MAAAFCYRRRNHDPFFKDPCRCPVRGGPGDYCKDVPPGYVRGKWSRGVAGLNEEPETSAPGTSEA